MKKVLYRPQTMRKNERKENWSVQNPKTRKKYNVKEQIHIQLYRNRNMKNTIVKEFSDWTVEEMVEYVLTGRKPKV